MEKNKFISQGVNISWKSSLTTDEDKVIKGEGEVVAHPVKPDVTML